MLHRGILLTPFHHMTLISLETTAAQVRRHTEMFEEAVGALIG
ncbi:MAG: hypothetical protein KatS3mg071_0158 [Meiothermus sp.]|jgi:glutamate-1-semialdehyde 2,1-aminomutase|nr:MAG: hypothetical protein KatS3mg071_0158 [Meiothermus sp.]